MCYSTLAMNTTYKGQLDIVREDKTFGLHNTGYTIGFGTASVHESLTVPYWGPRYAWGYLEAEIHSRQNRQVDPS